MMVMMMRRRVVAMHCYMNMTATVVNETIKIKVRLCGGVQLHSTTTSDELDFAAPFGPTAAPARGKK